MTKPFVRWVGGKRQLLPELEKRMPDSYTVYWEPFVGGGALFFHLQPRSAYLSDANEELINAYTVVRDDVDCLLPALKLAGLDEETYYAVRHRDREYNNFRQDMNKWERACRFIYLNKTCFNGLYRVNSRGEFNVPYGHRKNPNVCDEENLRDCSEALQNASIEHHSYEKIEKYISSVGEFMYLDPPYVPLSVTSNFTQYTRDGFTGEDQERLFNFCKEADENGVKWMQSNSSAPWVLEKYAKYNVELVDVSRNVAAKASSRKKVKEVIIRNYD